MGVTVVELESKVLQGNRLGDSHLRRIPIYLPPGYEDGQTRYPTVYFLAGFGGGGTTLLSESLWEENLPQRLDRLIKGGSVRPLIAVMPNCATRLGGSQYLNSSGTGRYQDHLIVELVPFVDANYRTIPQREQRAVMGKSSGGYGATILGMQFPGVFGLVADHSGDKYFELCYKADIPRCVAGLAPYEHSVERFLTDFPHPGPERRAYWFDVVNMLAMASCYSPSSTGAGFDLPFDTYTGELRPELWQRWLANDPVELVARHRDSLESLLLYFLDCGHGDEHHLQLGNRIYSARLRDLGIRHTYQEFAGGHRNVAHRYDVSLRIISETLGRG